MIQVMGFPQLPMNDYSTDWQISLHGHFPPYSLPTFFFAQFNPFLLVIPLWITQRNSSPLLAPYFPQIFADGYYFSLVIIWPSIWIRSFIFSCYPVPLASSIFWYLCSEPVILKNVLTALEWKGPNLSMRLFSKKL